MLRVRDLMSRRLLTVRDNTSVGRADQDMQLERVRHFPVVDARRNLVGVLSSADLAKAYGPRPPWGRARPVAELMTREVRTIRVDAPAYEAARRMIRHKIRSLVVVDDSGGVVGMITDSDFLGVAVKALTGQPVRRKRAA